MVEIIKDSPGQSKGYLSWDDTVNSTISQILNAGLPNDAFIPESIPNIAENSDNIYLNTSFDIIKQQWKIRIIETNYPHELTNKVDYEKWQEDLHQAKNDTSKKFKILPDAPPTVDRLHAKYYKEINSWELNLDDRLLLQCRIAKSLWNDEALYVHEYDWEKSKWIAKDFYINTLPRVAKQMWFRFIVWDQNHKNIDFFINKIWRYMIFDLKPKYRATLFGCVFPEDLFTFQFLYQEDIEKYILPNKIK